MPKTVTKQLDRSLGLASVYSIAVGAMMGSGIFVLPGLAAAIAGPWVSISYLLAGFLVVPALFSKAELATAMPVAGGTFVYIERSMGPWMGTVVGLGTWFALSAKTAFALVGLGGYLVLFSDWPPQAVSLTILGSIVALNILGAAKASSLQRWVVYGCLGALATFITMGWPTHFFGSDLFLESNWRHPNLPTGVAGIIAGAGFVFVSYNGVTKVCSVAEEIRNPERNIPLGMMLAQLSVMVLYTLVSLVITTSVPYDSLADDLAPIATAAMAIAGPTAQTAMAIVAVAALSSMCNAGVMASARFPFAMGRANTLPTALANINSRTGTPITALLVTGLLLFLLVTLFPVYELAKLASGFTIFIFCVENLAVVVLRESGTRWYRPTFRSPLYPWTQAVGILGGLWLLYQLGLLAIGGVCLSLAVGSFWYFIYARHRIDRKGLFRHLWGEAQVLKATERAEAMENSDEALPQVIVPVFGGEPAPSRLVQLAAAFASNKRLEVLRLEEVPDQAHLSSFLELDEDTRDLARRAAQIGQSTQIEVDFHDIVTHNAKHALRQHAETTKADWIVMEWPTRSELHYIIRHPFTWWLNNPPCDLAIFLDRAGPFDGDTQDDFQRILILAEPGPYDSLMVHVADCLAATQRDARVTLFWPISDNASAAEVDQNRQYHEQLASLCASPCESRIVRGRDPFSTIAKVSAEYDLLIMGAPEENTLRTLFFGSKEHRAANVAQCSVLKLKAPRHQVHHRFDLRREDTQEQMILAPHIHHAVVGHNIQVNKKQDLFKLVGTMLQDAKATNHPEGVTAALFERERQQNTALREGVAISAPTVEGLRHTQVVVLTLDRAIDYQSSGQPMVDVVLLVLAPRTDRQAQLWVLERLARMALRSDLLQLLREADSEEALREAVLTVVGEKKI
jgi:amino acid transporter/mannitol/fructose-specific phosphotransferase system IIA component (Ntr-type)